MFFLKEINSIINVSPSLSLCYHGNQNNTLVELLPLCSVIVWQLIIYIKTEKKTNKIYELVMVINSSLVKHGLNYI